MSSHILLWLHFENNVKQSAWVASRCINLTFDGGKVCVADAHYSHRCEHNTTGYPTLCCDFTT